jgi:hypothetical protein
MVDLAQLLGGGGNDPTGLLTPQQQGDINQTSLQSIAAGLMKAGGPSPYKANMTALSGIGEALQGGIAARRQAQQDALTQTMVRSKTLEGVAPLLKLQQEYSAIGVPLPPNYQRVLDSVIGLTTGGRPAAPGTAGAPGAASGTPISPQQNLILQTADKLGISRYDLLPSSGNHDVAMQRIGDEIKANQGSLDAAERRKAIMTSDVARSEKNYPAFVSLGQQGRQAKQDTELSTALINEPGFTSGFGSGLSELAKKFVVSIGGDLNAAFPMEAFRKITAANINTQIGEMKTTAQEMGGAAGRVFQSQINLMEKASQNLENTPAANRFLANLQARAADLNIALSKEAIKYKKEHGILDAGFDEKVDKYVEDHPLFSADEYKSLGKIATPPGTPGAPGAAAPTIAVPTGATKEVLVGGQVVGHVVNGQYVPMQPQQAAGPAPVPR